MLSRKFISTLLAMVIGMSLFFFSHGDAEELKLVPKKRALSSGDTVIGTKVGTGWTIKENTKEAVGKAV